MQVSSRVDYGLRALLEIAAAPPGVLVKADAVAREQHLPAKYLEAILTDLRRGGILVSQRGADGGFGLAAPAEQISVADVYRTLEGPLTVVRGVRPDLAEYHGSAARLQDLWVAARAALRGVLESVTLADLLSGDLPDEVTDMVADPDAWRPRASGALRLPVTPGS